MLQALSARECPAPANVLEGLCYDGTLPPLVPATDGAGSPNDWLVGDLDGDGAVGVRAAALHLAWAGESVPPAPTAFDLDGDGVVGGAHDWHHFLLSFGTPGSEGLPPGRVEILEAGAYNDAFLEGDFTLAEVVFSVVGSGHTPSRWST